MQPRAAGCRNGHSRGNFLRFLRRTHARLRGGRRPHSLGLRYRARFRYGQRRSRTRWFHRWARGRGGQRDGVCQFRLLASKRHAGECAAGLPVGKIMRSLPRVSSCQRAACCPSTPTKCLWPYNQFPQQALKRKHSLRSPARLSRPASARLSVRIAAPNPVHSSPPTALLLTDRPSGSRPAASKTTAFLAPDTAAPKSSLPQSRCQRAGGSRGRYATSKSHRTIAGPAYRHHRACRKGMRREDRQHLFRSHALFRRTLRPLPIQTLHRHPPGLRARIRARIFRQGTRQHLLPALRPQHRLPARL